MTRPPATRPDWDGVAYHRLGRPQLEWGLRVLARLRLAGDETVLDAGCGSGRLTAELLRLVPRGRVLAVDLSSGMLSEAQRQLADSAERVRFVRADLAALPMVEAAEVVFSNATLHWVLDQERLFASLYRALKPGGRLEAQCGGGPNVARIRERAEELMRSPELSRYFDSWRDPWYFGDPVTAAERLRAAGFQDVETGLEPAPARFDDEATYRAFLTEVVIAHYLAPLPAEARTRFTDALVARALTDDPPLTLDYWRLNLSARRPM